VAQAFQHLGFPDYFRVELSWAKFLAIAVLLAPVPARLKEWAYAGFAITLVSALIAHFSVGDGPGGVGLRGRHERALGPLLLLLAPGADRMKGESPSQLIDARIKELDDWRGAMLSRLRGLIQKADPEVVEEWKWGGPAWSHDGVICTGETYKSVVKLTFLKGAKLKDPKKLFNSSLEGNTRRAIDFREGEKVDEAAFKALIREAVALNG